MARGRNRGFKNALSSFIVLIVLAAGILSWVKINNINSIESFYWHLRGWSDKALECGEDGVDGLKNCDFIEEGPKKDIEKLPDRDELVEVAIPSIKDSTTSSGKTEDNTETSTVDVSEIEVMLESLNLAEAASVDYVRSDWKHWTGSPCNTRQEVLIDQGEDVVVGDKCKITSGSWVDPYSLEVFTESSKLDIDHLIPLGYAAKMGGNDWDKELKQQFANDRMHLLAVSAKENRSKGDKGPGSYMPPNKEFHCEYATIWITTSYKYDLSITGKDRNVLEKALKTC